jgi:hypothetical protein
MSDFTGTRTDFVAKGTSDRRTLFVQEFKVAITAFGGRSRRIMALLKAFHSEG